MRNFPKNSPVLPLRPFRDGGDFPCAAVFLNFLPDILRKKGLDFYRGV